MSKQSISAKLNPKLLQKTDQLARRLKLSRNKAVEEGLQMWIETRSRELLADEFKKASLEVREESLKDAKDWEIALLEGLNDGPDSDHK